MRTKPAEPELLTADFLLVRRTENDLAVGCQTFVKFDLDRSKATQFPTNYHDRLLGVRCYRLMIGWVSFSIIHFPDDLHLIIDANYVPTKLKWLKTNLESLI